MVDGIHRPRQRRPLPAQLRRGSHLVPILSYRRPAHRDYRHRVAYLRHRPADQAAALRRQGRQDRADEQIEEEGLMMTYIPLRGCTRKSDLDWNTMKNEHGVLLKSTTSLSQDRILKHSRENRGGGGWRRK